MVLAIQTSFHSLWINTMNRCHLSGETPRPLAPFLFRVVQQLLSMLACVTGLGLGNLSQAQGTQRSFPPEALRGRLLITQPPDVTLNGHPARLSPGARIRGHNNLLLLSGSLAGKEQLVNYTRESNGLIHEIWILSEAEAQVPRNGLPLIGTLIPGTRTETVKVDDGRTPFDQLPVFKP